MLLSSYTFLTSLDYKQRLLFPKDKQKFSNVLPPNCAASWDAAIVLQEQNFCNKNILNWLLYLKFLPTAKSSNWLSTFGKGFKGGDLSTLKTA